LKAKIKAQEEEDETDPPAEDKEVEEEEVVEGEGEEEEVVEDEEARKEIASLRAELKEVRKLVAKNNGEDALENTGGAPTASKPTNWTEALAHIAKRDGVGMAEAGRKASKEFPDLHPAARR